MDTEELDEHSHSLIPPEELEEAPTMDHQYSAPTGHEIAMILKYVQHNKPTRMAEMRQYLQQTTSFTNDTDAQDAWRYAQSLVQTSSPSVADSRTGHVDPHEQWAKGPHE